MKQIPYAIDDFECIINEDYYYIDKTRHIETVEMQALQDDFTINCKGCVRDLITRYKDYFTDEDCEDILSHKSAKAAVVRITSRAAIRNLPLYLFIDEYDNSSYTVLVARGVKGHEAITHGERFYRDLFKVCKGSFRHSTHPALPRLPGSATSHLRPTPAECQMTAPTPITPKNP